MKNNVQGSDTNKNSFSNIFDFQHGWLYTLMDVSVTVECRYNAV